MAPKTCTHSHYFTCYQSCSLPIKLQVHDTVLCVWWMICLCLHCHIVFCTCYKLPFRLFSKCWPCTICSSEKHVFVILHHAFRAIAHYVTCSWGHCWLLLFDATNNYVCIRPIFSVGQQGCKIWNFLFHYVFSRCRAEQTFLFCCSRQKPAEVKLFKTWYRLL